MPNNELTEWFPAEYKPFRRGLYQVKSCLNPDSPLFSYWNGSYWGWIAEREKALEDWYIKTMRQNLEWRGLKEPAK